MCENYKKCGIEDSTVLVILTGVNHRILKCLDVLFLFYGIYTCIECFASKYSFSSHFQTGFIRFSRGHYFIEPVRGYNRSSGEEHPHLIYSSSALPTRLQGRWPGQPTGGESPRGQGVTCGLQGKWRCSISQLPENLEVEKCQN